MDVLVTGATGFVGRAAVAALRAEGHRIRALCPSGIEAPEGTDAARGDISDEPSVRAAAEGCGAVVHLARVDDPHTPLADAERINLIGAENVLAAAREAGVKRLVHLSTEAVTRGREPRSYVDEKYPQPARFLDAVSETSALAEDLVTAASGGGIETVVLRPGVIWGAGDDDFLPRLLRRVRAGALSWVDDGRALIATTYIDNLSLALRLAVTAPDAAGGVFYVTDDERTSRREFVGNLLRAAGAPVPRGSLPYGLAYAMAWLSETLGRAPPGMRAEVVAEGRSAHFNIQRARAALGYAPEVSVAEGTKRVGAWVAERGGWEALAGAS